MRFRFSAKQELIMWTVALLGAGLFAAANAADVGTARIFEVTYDPGTGIAAGVFTKRPPEPGDSVFVSRWHVPPGSRIHVFVRDSMLGIRAEPATPTGVCLVPRASRATP